MEATSIVHECYLDYAGKLLRGILLEIFLDRCWRSTRCCRQASSACGKRGYVCRGFENLNSNLIKKKKQKKKHSNKLPKSFLFIYFKCTYRAYSV